MEQLGPWAFCIGAFCVWPGLLFFLGWGIGKYGLPFEIRRRDRWGQDFDDLD